eukprot:937169-Pelagomonas_calceolata.AAC.4
MSMLAPSFRKQRFVSQTSQCAPLSFTRPYNLSQQRHVSVVYIGVQHNPLRASMHQRVSDNNNNNKQQSVHARWW